MQKLAIALMTLTLAGCGTHLAPGAVVAPRGAVAVKSAKTLLPTHMVLQAATMTGSYQVREDFTLRGTSDQGAFTLEIVGENTDHLFYIPPCTAATLNGRALPLDDASTTAMAQALRAADASGLAANSDGPAFQRATMVMAVTAQEGRL